MKTTQPIQDYRNNDKNYDNDNSDNFISAGMSHVVTSALVSKSLISVRHICLILKLFCHIIIINDNNNDDDDTNNNKNDYDNNSDNNNNHDGGGDGDGDDGDDDGGDEDNDGDDNNDSGNL